MQSEEFSGKSAEMRKDSPWLSSEDLLDAGEVEVEIEGVFKHRDAVFDDGRKETVFAVKFKGKQKQLVLNNTNRKRLVKRFATTKVSEWIGKKCVLYVDRHVRPIGGKKGEEVCGIRVKE